MLLWLSAPGKLLSLRRLSQYQYIWIFQTPNNGFLCSTALSGSGLLYPGAEDVEFVEILKSQRYGQLQIKHHKICNVSLTFKDVESIHVLLDNPTWLSRVWPECACKNAQLCNWANFLFILKNYPNQNWFHICFEKKFLCWSAPSKGFHIKSGRTLDSHFRFK